MSVAVVARVYGTYVKNGEPIFSPLQTRFLFWRDVDLVTTEPNVCTPAYREGETEGEDLRED